MTRERLFQNENKSIKLADLVDKDDSTILAKGGIGGKGNAFFKSSTNQSPRHSQPGEKGEEKTIWLRLKLIADVGLVGLPNRSVLGAWQILLKSCEH